MSKTTREVLNKKKRERYFLKMYASLINDSSKATPTTDEASHLFRSTRCLYGGSKPCSNVAAAISSKGAILAGSFTMTPTVAVL